LKKSQSFTEHYFDKKALERGLFKMQNAERKMQNFGAKPIILLLT
jgi:hypothetical protein